MKKMKKTNDRSQLNESCVLCVLQFLRLSDFGCGVILTCQAWYHNLNKPRCWMFLRKNVIKRQYLKLHPEKDYTLPKRKKPKQVTRALMSLKLGHKNYTPSPDDIYQNCMQELQKLIARSNQDLEDTNERVKAGNGVLKWLQTSMYSQMHQVLCFAFCFCFCFFLYF